MDAQQRRLSLFLLLATCLGIGIFRFSYTALLPSTRLAFEWSSEFASLLGSANLLGYLIGAVWAMRLNRQLLGWIQAAAFLGSLSLFCCAFAGFEGSWYLFWRILSGICGGWLMILAPSIVAQHCKLQHRFKINVIGFSGIGLGVLLATLFLPYLDHISTSSAWLILCAFAVLCSLGLILLKPKALPVNIQSQPQSAAAVPINKKVFASLLLVYSCSAFSYVPHSLFWIDYLSQVQQLSLFWINSHWILYGLGSACGAACAYFLAKQLGNFKALKILYCLYVAAILAAIAPWSVMTFLSSFFTGLLNPAVVFLTSYTLLQLYGLAYKKLWGMATLCFASVQLIGGLSFSGLQVAGWSYPQQFLLAGAVLALGNLYFICSLPATKTPVSTIEVN